MQNIAWLVMNQFTGETLEAFNEGVLENERDASHTTTATGIARHTQP